ncbi:alpha/beta hydrolase [Streptomyces sp. ISL-98]|uniref:alpha/beta hydrolase n=1 Tax=Streptomyces sp. ISL-98 TaxID=2819192 RepID=UPI001BEC2D08|nr:alpha/beta hydrolase [Streptomyces sp. ISL-98]MBT2510064.1 alpha/beta hydrolase [Streptomyces sp. ISL-98]
MTTENTSRPARESYGPVPGGRPGDTHRPHVLRVGPDDASTVLVLLGGREGSAGVFRPAARHLAARIPGLQVWAVDRREQTLSDLSGFTLTPEAARAYYLGGTYQQQSAETAPEAGEWGLAVLLDDVRDTVRAASDGGRRKVVLGGHSLGAAEALLYAAWDFDGHPGHRDIDGLVAIDGGVHHAFTGAGFSFELSLEDAKGWLQQTKSGAYFENASSTGAGFGELPELAALWFQLAAVHAVEEPDALSPLAAVAPEPYRSGEPLTNRGFFGHLVDASMHHPGFKINSGRPDGSGGWTDDGPTPLDRAARAFAATQPGSWVWYTLNRLMIDLVGAVDFTSDGDLAQLLGLRVQHGKEIQLPFYAVQSGFSNGTVGQAAAKVAAESRIGEFELHTDAAISHQDLLLAEPDSNILLRTLPSFLRRIASGEPR